MTYRKGDARKPGRPALEEIEMTRQIVDVTHKVGEQAVTERFNAAYVEYSNGNLIIYDAGIIAAFTPGMWLSVRAADPEEEPPYPADRSHPSNSAANSDRNALSAST